MYPSYTKTFTKDIVLGDKTISVEIGKFSEQATAAVLARCGETVVHTTVALGREVDLGYFPLSVEYAEKLYAGGIIKGSQWVKRDGRPTDDQILTARVIDRTMRPLFPEGIRHEVQVINTVFSYDKENSPDMVALVATAVGLSISAIPFDGPVAGLRIAYKKETGEYVINPSESELEGTDLDLIVSGTGDSIVMVEAGSNEVSEDVLVEAFRQAQAALGKACKTIAEIAKEVGREKLALGPKVTPESEAAEAAHNELLASLKKKYAKELADLIEKDGKLLPTGLDELSETVAATLNKGKAEDAEDLVTAKQIAGAFHELMASEARVMILEKGERPDGRTTEEIRPIWCEVDVFPRTHGSAMFKRGATQAVTITTLGSPSLGQHIEDITGMNVRHYMHHYNMPPYASGEAGRFGAPKRREIGHGALAERALLPMLPPQVDFPYTIHVVTEILSSNGSTSQASVCGSTMSLMAAGVPLKRPVAGIAMGLITDGKGNNVVLSDIQGVEDHIGDMDFKVAGTAEGVTALQMDIKIKGLTLEIMETALAQAKAGRLHILGKMLEAIAEPRKEISQYAPKIQQLIIPAEKIGELIGPGGKNIKAIIAESGAEIDVDEDERGGIVNITTPDQEKMDKAVALVTGITRDINIGDEFDGPVVRIEAYGAFVNILPNRDGLVHVSAMAPGFVRSAEDVVQMGQVVHVRVSDIQEDGKIKLTMLTPEQEEQQRNERTSNGGGDSYRGGGDRGGDRPAFRGRPSGGSGYGGGRSGGGRGPSYGGGRGGDRGGRGGGSYSR
jgi:polyribonucleotide nucleotidyltransferase